MAERGKIPRIDQNLQSQTAFEKEWKATRAQIGRAIGRKTASVRASVLDNEDRFHRPLPPYKYNRTGGW